MPFNDPKKDMTDDELDHSPLGFGKYSDQTPDQLLEVDAQYLCWAFENIKGRKVCSGIVYKEALAVKREQANKRFQSAPASPSEIIKAKEVGKLFDTYDEDHNERNR